MQKSNHYEVHVIVRGQAAEESAVGHIVLQVLAPVFDRAVLLAKEAIRQRIYNGLLWCDSIEGYLTRRMSNATFEIQSVNFQREVIVG